MSGRASALKRARAVAVVSLAVAAVMPLGAAQAAPAQTGCNARVNNTYPKLLECVRLSEVRAHQAALQAIADDNDGHRFSGFEGYNESVDYVVDTLRASGYDPQVQTFDYLAFQPVGPSVLQQVAPNTITYVENTDFGLITQSDSGDVTANVTAVDLQLGLGQHLDQRLRGRPTSRASRPATSRCCSAARARSRSRPRTPRRPAPSGS